MTPIDFVIGAALIVACITDLTKGRIPNILTLPLWPAGVIYWLVVGPWYHGLVGLLVAFVVHFGLWMFQVNRGGDAKLMIGIAAFIGYAEALEATGWELILFGPATLIWVAARGDWANWWTAQKYAIAKTLGPFLSMVPIASLQNLDLTEEPEVHYVPKAPFIAAAVAIGRFTDWFQVFHWTAPPG